MRYVFLVIAVAHVHGVCARGQSIKDCATVFVQPMPESLDRFVSAELVRWGQFKVVTRQDKAVCVASFGRREATVDVKSSGSATVPAQTTVKAENTAADLPTSGVTKEAALEFVHVATSVVVWAHAASDGSVFWMQPGSTAKVARKLVELLKKDYARKAK